MVICSTSQSDWIKHSSLSPWTVKLSAVLSGALLQQDPSYHGCGTINGTITGGLRIMCLHSIKTTVSLSVHFQLSLDIPAQPKVSRYLWCRKLVVNNGINYQPQLVSDSRSSEPSTVSLKKSHKKLGVTGEPWGFLGKIGDGTLGKIRGISTPPSESD